MSSSVGNTPKESRNLMPKVVQTAGRDALGTFAPQFAALNDDVLFGEVWSNDDLTLKMRSILTVTTLVAKGMADTSFEHHVANAKKNGVSAREMAAILTHVAFYAGWPNAWAAFRVVLKVYADDPLDLENPEAHGGIFGLGDPNDAYAQYFTGQSYLNPLTDPAQTQFIANVTFEPVAATTGISTTRPKAAAKSCSSPTAKAGTRSGASPPARSSRVMWCTSRPT